VLRPPGASATDRRWRSFTPLDQRHLARTLGTELSHETISNITDAVLEEVKAWQTPRVIRGFG